MRRRKIYIVNKRYQLKFIFAFVGVTFATLLTVTLMLVNDISDQIDGYLRSPAGSLESSGELILPVILKSFYPASIALFLILVAMSLVHYRHTRRVTSSLSRCIAGFKEGNLCREAVSCAGSDFLRTEEAFKGMLDASGDSMERLKGLSREIDQILSEAEGEGGLTEGRIRALEEKMEAFEKTTGRFKFHGA